MTPLTQPYWVVLPRFRSPNDGGPAGWYAIYEEEDQPVAFLLSVAAAKRLAAYLNEGK